VADWTKYRMARDLAGPVFPTSEAVILQTARKNGIVPVRLVHRPKSTYWIIRGTLRGIRVEESTGTDNKKIAEEIRAKREAEILAQSVYGRRATATFAEAALSYLENGGNKRFLDKVIRYFGTTSLAKIDQDAIDVGARKIYPNTSGATRNRQFYTPVSAVIKHSAKRG
jgi:hypothetical protein